jgi:ParB family transcriptional regulator, chromosome partitioning protein
MGKKSLGRGLDAIFHDHALPAESESQSAEGFRILKIPLSEIDANPFQPRKHFDDSEITELAETIKEHGLIQPITVRKHNNRYQIVSGERRTRAARLAGLTEIDARVYEMLSDKTMMEWAIIENIQRVDLNPVEVSQSYEQLIENHGYTHEDLAKRLGKSRSSVTNSLRLLKLPASVLSWVADGSLSVGAARTLLSPEISDPEKAARQIIDSGMNVRAAEKAASSKSSNSSNPKSEPKQDPHISQIILDIQYALGARVKILPKGKTFEKGSIFLEYESLEDLSRIRDILAQQPV